MSKGPRKRIRRTKAAKKQTFRFRFLMQGMSDVPTEIKGVVMLWRAKINQHLCDIHNNVQMNGTLTDVVKSKSLNWLRSRELDFASECAYLDPDWVRGNVNKIISEGKFDGK